MGEKLSESGHLDRVMKTLSKWRWLGCQNVSDEIGRAFDLLPKKAFSFPRKKMRRGFLKKPEKKLLKLIFFAIYSAQIHTPARQAANNNTSSALTTLIIHLSTYVPFLFVHMSAQGNFKELKVLRD
jgi:hypothetical protein